MKQEENTEVPTSPVCTSERKDIRDKTGKRQRRWRLAVFKENFSPVKTDRTDKGWMQRVRDRSAKQIRKDT
jgi:hypothetical protein